MIAHLPHERLAHLARRLHSLGERPLYEFLAEIEAGAPLILRLEAYARLSPFAGFIAAVDGDRLPLPRIVAGRWR